MQLLPLELKRLIVELSSNDSLAALARTHSIYQREAERALYNTLSIYSVTHRSLKCMETLATNPEKAALVRFLTVQYARGNVHYVKTRNQRVTIYLLKILINMHSLSDFRITTLPDEVEAQMSLKSLGKILWSVCKILIL